MNSEIKKKWLAALRSGEYKQGKKCLKKDDKYCCLGVLCDLHSKETGKKWEPGWSTVAEYYDGEAGQLPTSVLYWSGLTDPSVITNKKNDNNLIYHNDGGRSFKQIAAVIERVL